MSGTYGYPPAQPPAMPPPSGPGLPGGVPPWMQPPPRRNRTKLIAWLVAGAIVLLVVLGLAAVNLAKSLGEQMEDNVPVLHNRQAQPVAEGRPWGAPCQPVTIAALGMPDDVFREFSGVVMTAHAAGVPVSVVRDVPHPDDTGATVVWLPPGTPATMFPEAHVHANWWAPEAPGRGPATLQSVRIEWHGDVFAQDADAAAMYRRYARSDVGQIFGLGKAWSSKSAFGSPVTQTPDLFRPSDLVRLREMAGCG